MDRLSYVIDEEPRGLVYRRLLHAGLAACTEGILVVRSTIDLDESARKTLEAARSHMLKREIASEWPGTVLLHGTAELYRFRYDYTSYEILAEHADSLFEWQQPRLPEDLALIRPDGTPWLSSISHEQYAELLLEPEEALILSQTLPELKITAQ